MKYFFDGSLNHRNELPFHVKKAYSSYKNQKIRCENKSVRPYRDYGKKGIRVEYTVREFVGWYLENIKKFKGQDPVVGRIDHARNYSLDNIEIVSRSENSKEATERNKENFSYPVIAKYRKNGKVFGIFGSMKEASIAGKNSFSTVQRPVSYTQLTLPTKPPA